MGGIVKDHHYVAGPTVKITVADTAISLGDTGNIANIQPTMGDWALHSATCVWVECVTSDIYYALGGATPATDGSIGHTLPVGALLELRAWQNIKNAKFIRKGAVSGAIMVTPFFNDTGRTGV